MRRRYFVLLIIATSLLMHSTVISCTRTKSAESTIAPVKQYFESLGNPALVSPNLQSIENNAGSILTWKIDNTDYSWVLAKNTDDLKKALVFFDAARSWNTEEYVFLPVTMAALEVHKKVGLTVPQSIYDEDGMNRIKELVLEGKAPEGGFVEQFDKFME